MSFFFFTTFMVKKIPIFPTLPTHRLSKGIAVDQPQMISIEIIIRAILFLNDEITHVRVKISINRLVW